MDADSMHECGGNVYDKYASRHPIERRLVRGFLRELYRFVDKSRARSAHEVGCGEGELSLMLAARGLQIRGSDVSAAVIDEARRRALDVGLEVPFEVRSIHELALDADSAELIICCEVMEHLDDPSAGLEMIARLADPWAIVSVPREPLWRALNMARLKYVGALGNTPGHLQHWSRRGFLRFLERRLDVVATSSPIPWTMALCRARAR
jgi:2-polyprenyl-3-methyl-5-hydroxy-6-metoxy-1,4-benzoquinol methylase